jgi:hypothetical protein
MDAEGIQDVPSFDPNHSAHPLVRELAERQGYLTPESQPPPSPPTEIPNSQESPQAGIDPEDVGSTLSYDEVHPPLSDAERQVITELLEEAIRGAPHLSRMYENRWDEVIPPILFHDALVEPGGELLAHRLAGHFNESAWWLVHGPDSQGVDSHNFVSGRQSMEPNLMANAFVGEAAITPSENTTVEVPVDFEPAAPTIEPVAHEAVWDYEDLEKFMVFEERTSPAQSM